VGGTLHLAVGKPSGLVVRADLPLVDGAGQ
jgi:hypothetical protein